MKCDRLFRLSLVKNWYLKVQEEAMAPARMVKTPLLNSTFRNVKSVQALGADPGRQAEEAEKIGDTPARDGVLPNQSPRCQNKA